MKFKLHWSALALGVTKGSAQSYKARGVSIAEIGRADGQSTLYAPSKSEGGVM